LMIIRDVFPLPILTFLLFSRVGKPILDTMTRLSMVWFGAGLGTFDLNLNLQNMFGSAVC